MGDLGKPAPQRRGLIRGLGPRLRRLWRYHPLAVFAGALLVLGSGAAIVGGTFASFTAVTANNTSTFAGGWVGPATSLATPAVSGYDTALTWSPGTHGPVTGQQLYGTDGGTGGSASCGSYSSVATMGSATTASYTDSNRASGSLNGHWYCYEMVSTSASNWTATATFTPVQIGLIMTALSVNASVTANNTVGTGDVIVATFNQPTTIGTITNSSVICQVYPGDGTFTVYLNDGVYGGAGNPTCTAAGGASRYLIALTGMAKGGGGGAQTVKATITTAGNSVTWTLTANGQAITAGATIVGNPTTTILSSAVTDQATVCTTATFCTPTATGNGF